MRISPRTHAGAKKCHLLLGYRKPFGMLLKCQADRLNFSLQLHQVADYMLVESVLLHNPLSPKTAGQSS